ncbi:MAG: hypothetical protein A3F67_00965 [Verrucomicrobia bacterium RIFCSPHIGHO2_12_FULL_41_10]|nr:MAG: hypothetical protein A3F67_00965 [Verrucomicrobia bacterium RIFCSPHIGHO2_12_FULL_41_10]HLB33206.1 glutaredoxin domain-containing protein [Chthoniobacterales bacterium]
MKKSLPKLYVKTGCPWCHEAIEWLDARHIRYELIDVRSNQDAFNEMIAISGQQKTPTLQTPDHRVLADFGVEQLPDFLEL